MMNLKDNVADSNAEIRNRMMSVTITFWWREPSSKKIEHAYRFRLQLVHGTMQGF